MCIHTMEFYSALKKNELLHAHTLTPREGVGGTVRRRRGGKRRGVGKKRERKGMYVAWYSNFLQTATFLSGARVVVGGPRDPKSGSYKYQGPVSQL